MPDGRPPARVVSPPSIRPHLPKGRPAMRSPAPLALTLLLALPFAASCQEWEKLFNGKDLTGWKGRADLWSVKDGAITGYTMDGKIPGGNSFLVWEGTAG